MTEENKKETFSAKCQDCGTENSFELTLKSIDNRCDACHGVIDIIYDIEDCLQKIADTELLISKSKDLGKSIIEYEHLEWKLFDYKKDLTVALCNVRKLK